MSRLTATQIIAQGDYLEDDFNPATLTVSQLLGVLGFHNIIYPTPYSKPKLVQTFNDEVKPRASKFKKERIKKANSIASDDGIRDGVTGEFIGGKKPPARRSSRRLSRAPSDDEDISPPRPDPKPKRRRSTAQPSLGGPSQAVVPKIELIEPPLFEESEPEDDIPVRKVIKSKKNSQTAGASSRRLSTAEDSGWEDNNIFQSGAESSSPLRPSPVRKPRKSTAPRKSRKSASAPPQLSPPPSPARASPVKQEKLSPADFVFSPQLSPLVSRESRRLSSTFKSQDRLPTLESQDIEEEEPEHTSLHYAGDERDVPQYEEYSIELKGGDDESDQEYNAEQDEEQGDAGANQDYEQVMAIQERFSQDSDASYFPTEPEQQSSIFARLFYLLLIFSVLAATINYKLESAPIGFCDTGKDTNAALERLRARRIEVEACNQENRTLLHDSIHNPDINDEPCPLPPLVPYVLPDACTPCPKHATCTQDTVSCETGYLLRSHPLLFLVPPYASRPNGPLSTSTPPGEAALKILSFIADGLPGLGSVALPPRCVEDPARQRRIGNLGRALGVHLGQVRGERVCSGDADKHRVSDSEGGEAKRWGLEEAELKEQLLHQNQPSTSFDDMFREAVDQSLKWGNVIMGEDKSGKRYLAHKTPSLTWTCALTVKARETWAEWQATVIGLATVFFATLAMRNQRSRQISDRTRAATLVPTALEALRNQELAHHVDPITTPRPYLSSVQLRDLILQEEHSVDTRKRIWAQVERVVESNANVRANLEEVHGGDEQRVWRWVGSSGRLSLG